MRICAFGNSHLIAMKDAAVDTPLAGRITFAADNAKKFSIRPAGDVISLRTRKYCTFADDTGPYVYERDYGAFLVVGLEFTLRCAADLYLEHRLSRHANRGQYRIISEPALHAALKDALASSAASKVARQLRTMTDKPILLLPSPNPVDSAKSIELSTEQLKFTYGRWRIFADNEIAATIYAAFLSAAKEVADELGVTIVPQPDDTMTPILTKAEYLAEQKPRYDDDLRPAARENDLFHMNALYGGRILNHIIKILPQSFAI